MSSTELRKIQTACDCLQAICLFLVTLALPGHIISLIVTLARLYMPQIARKVSIFVDRRSLHSTHSWWIAMFCQFSALKRSYYLSMVQSSTEHCRRVLWAASWVQSCVVWASTRAIPTSNRKPPWHYFGTKSKKESVHSSVALRTFNRLFFYSPVKFHAQISFCDHFAHIWTKNCLQKAKVESSSWGVSRDCLKIWIRNTAVSKPGFGTSSQNNLYM